MRTRGFLASTSDAIGGQGEGWRAAHSAAVPAKWGHHRGWLAIVENAYDQTMLLEGMTAAAIETREPDLLALACKHMPKLCVDNLDVLLLDETGKNVSGTGMDTNVRSNQIAMHYPV